MNKADKISGIFWEYKDIDALINNPSNREYVLSRILTCLPPKDVWEFTTPAEVSEKLDRIPFPLPGAKRMWETIIKTWRKSCRMSSLPIVQKGSEMFLNKFLKRPHAWDKQKEDLRA